eukprot:TRINITY_DN1751_c0_g1_i1.p2 TRINITY_DN1751_c0_g1~~TRINITY_DN1751_c0_g1_i1.p2  ORF type:complete len:202 (+),score=-14.32 TRINITY_DN1751_c0_g1_i1:125-730(+)
MLKKIFYNTRQYGILIILNYNQILQYFNCKQYGKNIYFNQQCQVIVKYTIFFPLRMFLLFQNTQYIQEFFYYKILNLRNRQQFQLDIINLCQFSNNMCKHKVCRNNQFLLLLMFVKISTTPISPIYHQDFYVHSLLKQVFLLIQKLVESFDQKSILQFSLYHNQSGLQMYLKFPTKRVSLARCQRVGSLLQIPLHAANGWI